MASMSADEQQDSRTQLCEFEVWEILSDILHPLDGESVSRTKVQDPTFSNVSCPEIFSTLYFNTVEQI